LGGVGEHWVLLCFLRESVPGLGLLLVVIREESMRAVGRALLLALIASVALKGIALWWPAASFFSVAIATFVGLVVMTAASPHELGDHLRLERGRYQAPGRNKERPE
jgi:hypothetical protein